jgi:Spy/CpxP family protein refolding chaperone
MRGERGEHPKDKEAAGHRGHGPGERWADELELSDEQRTAFKSVLREAFASFHGGRGTAHEQHHGHGAVLDAFQEETFSFDAVATPHDVAAHVSEVSGHVMDVVEKVLPLLTPAQRALAAQLIREHADHLPLGPH